MFPGIRKSVIFIIFLSAVCVFGSTKDETAIRKVIEDETKYLVMEDFEKWSGCWIHSSQAYFSITKSFDHFELHGWEAISTHIKEQMAAPGKSEWLPKKTDYQFRIVGNMAFVTFKEDGFASTRVLEKQKGKWKLLQMSVVQISEPAVPSLEMDKKSWHTKLSSLSSGVYAMGSITLKAETDTTEFEIFARKKFNPAFAVAIPGCKYIIAKAGRGANAGKYLLLIDFESSYIRDLYWPENAASEGSGLFWAFWEASGIAAGLWEEFSEFIAVWPEDWTDYAVMK
jgi:hypothetical protein